LFNYRHKPRSKRQEEKSIFYDIFIKPKENKIQEIRTRRMEEKQSKEPNKKENTKFFISNKTTSLKKTNTTINNNQGSNTSNVNSLHNTINNNNNNIGSKQVSINTTENKIMTNLYTSREDINSKNTSSKNTKQVIVNNSNEIIENNINKIKNSIINETKKENDSLFDYLSEKFQPKWTNKNFFNQLIQIKPPEGINAVVASPILDSKGWAPSIPSIQINKQKTSLSDLMMRAKGGIQAGDITKEAHMAFYLGMMNEEERHYEEALKFYKKYFLSAKMLQDIYGTELALNRIAVLYSNIADYGNYINIIFIYFLEQSLYYNEKHKDVTTHHINGFVAYYNCGICERILGKIENSINSFNQALQMAEEGSVNKLNFNLFII
jgi:tetratricopeptide (TPR) repeat protein